MTKFIPKNKRGGVHCKETDNPITKSMLNTNRSERFDLYIPVEVVDLCASMFPDVTRMKAVKLFLLKSANQEFRKNATR